MTSSWEEHRLQVLSHEVMDRQRLSHPTWGGSKHQPIAPSFLLGPQRHRPKPRARGAAHPPGLEQRLARLESEKATVEKELHALRAEVKALKEHQERATTSPVAALVDSGRIEQARQLVGLMLQASPSPALEHWARVLAPPTVHLEEKASGTPFSRNADWLREHAGEYAGRWVALREGVLLGADKSRLALHRRLEQDGNLAGATFARL